MVDGGTVYNNTNDIDFQNMHEAGDGSVYCTNAGEISEPCQDWQAKYCCAPKPKPKCKCCKAKPKVCCEDNGCSTAHPGFQCMNETAAANHPKTCTKHDTALCGKKKSKYETIHYSSGSCLMKYIFQKYDKFWNISSSINLLFLKSELIFGAQLSMI